MTELFETAQQFANDDLPLRWLFEGCVTPFNWGTPGNSTIEAVRLDDTFPLAATTTFCQTSTGPFIRIVTQCSAGHVHPYSLGSGSIFFLVRQDERDSQPDSAAEPFRRSYLVISQEDITRDGAVAYDVFGNRGLAAEPGIFVTRYIPPLADGFPYQADDADWYWKSPSPATELALLTPACIFDADLAVVQENYVGAEYSYNVLKASLLTVGMGENSAPSITAADQRLFDWSVHSYGFDPTNGLGVATVCDAIRAPGTVEGCAVLDWISWAYRNAATHATAVNRLRLVGYMEKVAMTMGDVQVFKVRAANGYKIILHISGVPRLLCAVELDEEETERVIADPKATACLRRILQLRTGVDDIQLEIKADHSPDWDWFDSDTFDHERASALSLPKCPKPGTDTCGIVYGPGRAVRWSVGGRFRSGGASLRVEDGKVLREGGVLRKVANAARCIRAVRALGVEIELEAEPGENARALGNSEVNAALAGVFGPAVALQVVRWVLHGDVEVRRVVGSARWIDHSEHVQYGDGGYNISAPLLGATLQRIPTYVTSDGRVCMDILDNCRPREVGKQLGGRVLSLGQLVDTEIVKWECSLKGMYALK